MNAEISSVIRVTDPDEALRKAALAILGALAKKFPEHNIGRLGGLDGENVLWFSRGLTELRALAGPLEDKTYSGPYVEIDYDRSKLDERSSFQEPLVAAALTACDGTIVSPTGSGKTVIETMLICRLKRRALILTHTTEIAKQISATFERLTGVTPGMIYGGVRDVRPVTVGLIQSVRSYDQILKEVGTLIIDEGHHISTPSYLAILAACPARNRYGLTATNEKTGGEERVVQAAIGPVLARAQVKDLQAQGFINKGTFRPIYTGAIGTWFDYVSSKCWYYKGQQKEPKGKPCPTPCTYSTDESTEKCVMSRGYFSWVYKRLAGDEIRNAKILNATAEALKDHPWIIVLTHLKDHARYLAKALAEILGDDKVRLCIGTPMKEAARKEAIALYRSSGGVFVATSAMIGEGFDAPKTSCLVRAMPAGGRVAVRQQTGRVMRPQDQPSLIIDFVDTRIVWLKRMWMGRRSIYKSIGFEEEVELKSQSELF
jgi:superfamily II DNA or RNA helicase